MAKKGPKKSGRPSALHHFAALPQRAIGDKRFRTRHFRVLAAVARSVDPETGCSLMSQKAIAKWAGMARQNVYGPLEDLIAWDFLEKIYRGRTSSGRYRTLGYRVKYAPVELDDDTHVGDKDRVTPVGDKPLSPTGVAESDLSIPDNYSCSEDPRSSETCDQSDPGSTSSPTGSTDKPVKPMPSHRRGCMLSSPATDKTKQADSHATTEIEIALSKASSWESELQNAAEQRICGALRRAFQGSSYSAALEAFTSDQYSRALELEMQKRWRGAAYLKRVVKLNLSK